VLYVKAVLKNNWQDSLTGDVNSENIGKLTVTDDETLLDGYEVGKNGSTIVNLGTNGNIEYYYKQYGTDENGNVLYDVIIYTPVPKVELPADSSGMFAGLTNAEEIILSTTSAKNVTSMEGLFEGNTSLETLDISSFEMQDNVTTTDMLSGCENLSTLTTPAQMGNNTIDISMANGGNGLYLEGSTTPTTQLDSTNQNSSLSDGAPIYPVVPESGVTMIDLIVLTMLTLTLSGVCVLILKNKNKAIKIK
jgi:surface protein